MTFKKLISILLSLAFWVPIVFLSLLLAHNALLYFTQGSEYGILPEKWTARQDWFWNVCFYIHLPTGILSLLSPLFLFSRLYYKGKLHLHRLIGQLYVWVTILLVCPTGIYLALYAKGGLITQVGFILQGLLLATFTYKGHKAIEQGDNQAHLAFMIRSYATVLVAVSFRIFHLLFFIWDVPYQDNYAISKWLALFANALLAELFIARLSISQPNSIQPVKPITL